MFKKKLLLSLSPTPFFLKNAQKKNIFRDYKHFSNIEQKIGSISKTHSKDIPFDLFPLATDMGKLLDLIREVADETIEDIKELDPYFFTRIFPGLNLENAYKQQLILNFLTVEIPLICKVINNCQNDRGNMTIFDSKIFPSTLKKFIKKAFPKADIRIDFLKIDGRRLIKKQMRLLDFFRFLSIVLDQFQRKILNVPIKQRGIICMMGTKDDILHIGSFLKFLKRKDDDSIYVISKFKKIGLKKFFKKTIECSDSYDLPFHLMTMTGYGQIKKNIKEAVSHAIKKDSIFLYNNLIEFFGIIQKAVFIQSLIERYSPRAVLGFFEASSWATVLTAFKDKSGFQLINIQHGFIANLRTQDLLDFDAYAVWNKDVYKTITQGGYKKPENIFVTGNPEWIKFKESQSQSEDADQYVLKKWLGSDKLIVLYTQPESFLISSASTRSEIIKYLAEYISSKSGVKLLIKKHARDHYAVDQEVLQSADIRCSSHDKDLFYQSLKLADVAVSLYSTAIMDIHIFGKPTISYDPSMSISKDFNFSFCQYRVMNKKDLFAGLDHCLNNSKTINISKDLFEVTSFSDYDLRIKNMLKKLKDKKYL